MLSVLLVFRDERIGRQLITARNVGAYVRERIGHRRSAYKVELQFRGAQQLLVTCKEETPYRDAGAIPPDGFVSVVHTGPIEYSSRHSEGSETRT